MKETDMSKKTIGVLDPRGRFHPHSGASDLSSTVATADAAGRVTGRAHRVAERDGRGVVRVVGTVHRPGANNQIRRSSSAAS